MSNNKARDLLKAAKLRKLQTIQEPTFEEFVCQDEQTNTSTDKTSSDEVNNKPENLIQERDEQKNVVKEKLALFDKIKKEPQMFKGGSFLGFQKNKPEPKKIINNQKELKEYMEEKDVEVKKPEDKDLKEKLMKRITSAKLNKGVNNVQAKPMGFSNELEKKLNPEKKKFILEDSDIQRIDIPEVSKIIIEEKKDLIEILMEKPVIKNKKKARLNNLMY
jgi:hypothetical protein